MSDSTHKSLWDKCRQIIKDNIPEDQYNTWFKNVESIKFENNELYLDVPTSFYAEYLEQKYTPLLKSVLHKVYGDKVKLFYQYYQVQGQPDKITEQSDNESSEILRASRTAPAANPFVAPTPGNIDPQLNPRYTFENYCGGESNKVVRSIAEAIANDPKNLTFNPLFIYGAVGVGKTHLMQAIGIRIKENNPASRVLYINARLFESQYRAAVAKKNDNNFFHFYQSIDTLLIDDIQDLAGKPGTQNTFFHIFNHLHQNNKQIIMSSDRAPADMEGFEERLLSRFKWGMAAELERPDLDLRRRILSQKAAQNGIELPWDVKEYIANNVTGNVRDLEGIMVSLLTYATTLNCPISMSLAQNIIAKMVKVQTQKPVNFEMIAEKVGTYYNLEPDVFFTKSRKREISDARQILMYLAKKIAKMTIVDIGKMLSRTHATVNYACNTIEERLQCDLQLQTDIQCIQAEVMK